MLQRAASNIDQTSVYNLKIQLQVAKSQYPQAVESGLTCLRRFGIDFPAHPNWEQVQAEYEAIWQQLGERPIESLIDLPLMTDPEVQAAMRVLSVLFDAAYFTDFNLYCLLQCRIVNVSLHYGMSGAAAHAYSGLGYFLGPIFHRYRDGYRFARLACDLVEKHGFLAYQAKVYFIDGMICAWNQPISDAIDFLRRGLRTANETGALAFACYCMDQMVAAMFVRNDPLDVMCSRNRKTFGLRQTGRLSRYADQTCKPSTLHRNHAGQDFELFNFQRCAIRRDGVRSTTDRRPGAHGPSHLLDPQTKGAVPVRGLRRSARGGR